MCHHRRRMGQNSATYLYDILIIIIIIIINTTLTITITTIVAILDKINIKTILVRSESTGNFSVTYASPFRGFLIHHKYQGIKIYGRS